MTDMGNKVLVSVAPVAATDKVIIPEKIAEDVYDCYKAGAAMVHLHVRDREGNPVSYTHLHPDYTVGFGITPNQPPKRVADYTAGRESHPAPKNLFICCF